MKNTIYKTLSVHWLLCALLILAGASQSFSKKVEFQTPPNAPSGLTATEISSSSIQLTWTDNSPDETGFRVERSLSADSRFESFAILPPDATYLVDHRLSADRTYFYRVSAINETGDSAYSGVANATTDSDSQELPYYWSNADIGSPNLSGSATFEDGFFQTTGNGRMNATSNAFHFVYQPLQGDGEIVAQLTKMLRAHWDHQGVMIKESLEPGSQYAMTELYRNDNIVMYKGRTAGEYKEVQNSSESLDTPIWLKMSRSGDQFTSSYSKDGMNWTEFNRETIVMGENTFVGLVSHASTNDKLSPGTWRDVAVSQSYLSAPTNLRAAPSANDEVILEWQDNSNIETGFRIERAIKGDTIIFEDLVEVAPDVTSFQDDGLIPGATYFYRIRAINGNRSSFPSNEETSEVLTIPNTALFLQRKAGDYDRTANNNTISVIKTSDTIKNTLRHPGMIGKQIDITLSQPVSSQGGAISLKIMPNTQQQTVEFFSSESLKMSQIGSQLMIDADNNQNSYSVTLDSITCNHIVLNFENGMMTVYVNGEFFQPVNAGNFEVGSFTLGEFNGNIWDVIMVNSKMSDQSINDQSQRCTNGVEASATPFVAYPYPICGVYQCLWVANESLIENERKRARLRVQEITFDRNTFDVGMYIQPDIDEWMKRERNSPAPGGFEYFGLNSLFTKNQSNTSYLLHENFHGFQVPLLKGGKWLAEASADWAAWNFYREPLKGTAIAAFTLNPHMGIFERFPSDSEHYHEVVRFYHSSIMLAYFTYFKSDQSLIGKMYNTPQVERNAFLTFIELLEDEGLDFDQEFAEFVARTSAWDYAEPEISDAYEINERKGISAGLPDLRFVDVMEKEGTYGVFQPVPEELLPGAYGWNSYRIDSTASSTYTLKIRGSDQNPQSLNFVGKVILGLPGAYEYVDLEVSPEVTRGDGEAEVEVTTEAGEQLFLVVVAADRINMTNDNVDFIYEYAIESSAHTLPGDHIRSFTLEEENRRAIIDHENLTINVEMVRGTNPSRLAPTIELFNGASSDPASGEVVDFTEPVTYRVTGPGSTSAKEWTVSLSVVPDRTGTDFLSFELRDLVPFSTINKENHTISVNLVSDINVSNVVPVFTLSEGATSSPASGQAIDLSSPVNYVVTAEDGETIQNWTVSTADFRPFITTWSAETANTNVSITLNDSYVYDFQYEWKDVNGSRVREGSFSSADGNSFDTTLPKAGTYTLEISGEFPHFINYSSDNLKDVNQWGDIPWRSMVLSFARWGGEGFSATDVPNLSRVTSMFAMFRDARSFNSDLSQWDVSNVTGMAEMFSGAREFNSDLSKWDVGNVVGMDQMFREARTFNSDISRWDVRKVRNMNRMFFAASSFDVNLGNWDISKVGSMKEMLRAGFSRLNYDRTLIGWSRQDVRESIDLGSLNGLEYCDAEDARTHLINEKKWIITGDILACPENGEANILVFELSQQTSAAILDFNDHTINAEVVTGVNGLRPTLILSKGATSSPKSREEVDFTEPVIYTVTSSDGTTQQWIVTVTTIETPLGTEGAEESVYVYPNPVKDMLHLETSQKSTVWLVDVQGRQVLPSKEGQSFLFNLESLENGLYLLRIKTNNKTTTRKIIKNN